MTHYSTPDTREEAVSQIPALHMMMVLGWNYLSPAHARDMRGSDRAVVLEPVLRDWLAAHRFDVRGQSHGLSDSGITQVIREVTRVRLNEGLITANEAIYKHLTLGITVTEFVEGQKISVTVPLVNWSEPDANLFQVTEELRVARRNASGTYRPDVVGYVNGLPLVVIEAKRPTASSPDKSMIAQGISQHLRNQDDTGIQELYAYSQLLLTISGSDAEYGTTKTPGKFWGKWQEEEISDQEVQAIKSTPLTPDQMDALFASRPARMRREFEQLHSGLVLPTEQDEMVISLLRRDRFLDLIRRFVFFDGGTSKIIARYQQFGGVKKILSQVTKQKPDGSREGGVVWHTTGSGKSNLMVFLAKALLLDHDLSDSRIIIVTDRIDLEKQLAKTFLTGGAFGSAVATKKDGEKAKVQSGRDLAQRIGVGTERIIFTLLQKFNSATKLPECHNTSDKLIVLVDEGHRSQGGENHERMRQALPNAAFIAFTGTPLLKEDKTRNKFGPILHAYTMQDAIHDKAVTPLVYEERKPIVDFNEQAVDAWFDQRTMGLSDQQLSDLKRKYATRGQVYKAANRIEAIAWDIATHFKENFIERSPGLKAQLATDSKLSAIRYKKALDETGLVTSAIVISPPDSREGHADLDASDTPEVQAWWNNNVGNDAEAYEARVIEGFGSDGAPDILIVVDKLLTGFDEPRNAVLYIDKHLKSHNLLQAIARVNRLHEKKQFGYLIDYRGILAELDASIQDYQDLAEETRDGYEVGDLIGTFSNVSTEYKRLPGLYDALWAIFADVENKRDREQLRRVLVPRFTEDEAGHSFDQAQKVREDFYEALTNFGMCLKLALSSRSFFEDRAIDEATISTYKKDLRYLTDLRIQAKRDASETVDFSEYEKQISRIVDRHVVTTGITDPDGFIRVETLGQGSPEDWSDDKTRTEADVIKTRLRKTIEQELVDDPYAQRVFSELLQRAIEDAEAMFEHPGKQYELFKDLEEQVSERNTPGIPDRFGDNPRAKAYYGVLLDHAGGQELTEDQMAEEASYIDTVVLNAIDANSVSTSNLEKAIHAGLLARYYKLLGGTEAAFGLIDQVLGIVRYGAKRN